MEDLFLKREAVIVQNHRYELRRIWDETKPTLVVVMLNPSSADHEKEDPTLHRLINFARAWGFGSLHVVNLYAWRSPDPKMMFAETDRVGERNQEYLDKACLLGAKNGQKILVAWGNDGDFEGNATAFATKARKKFRLELICLDVTLSNAPKHPMARGKHRIPDGTMPTVWLTGPNS